ncbi:hypothetical protein C4B63_40g110 [Trypanosoma cruzi]|uniref:Uncharacterized protein n=1 Tax=Trypanosoma cruzi TaxID=5693 RepID=A0A2V2V697_TRYCR|nr:hypothetical protein C4B63_40g110 [Trypanosoma cruzi]
MGGAMQRKLDDAEAEPLLQQCRKMASDMEALRRSEQRYRALVGDDDAGDRCADHEDPSTRAQCLHGIESALAALGVEESEEPAAAAIMRAAEEARAREEELHDRLDESAARGRALESKLSELTRTADSLQRALDGGCLPLGTRGRERRWGPRGGGAETPVRGLGHRLGSNGRRDAAEIGRRRGRASAAAVPEDGERHGGAAQERAALPRACGRRRCG